MRGRRAATSLTTLVTTAVVLVSMLGCPAQARTVGHHRGAQPRTAVTVALRHCQGCRVQAVHYVPAEDPDQWWSHWKKVDGHQEVVFDVPSSRTHGMTFFVDAPWAGNPGAASLLAARYPGHAVGSAVSHHDARHAHKVEACWAGTGETTARLVYRVERVRGRELSTGEKIKFPRAYAKHTLPAWPPMEPAYKGSAQAQDAIGCVNPAARPATRPAARPKPHTVLTLQAGHCNGCKVRIEQWKSIRVPPWISREKTVRHGRVRYRILTQHTHGLLVGVTGSWEADNTVPTGFQSLAVFRYAGHKPGSHVGFGSAQDQTRGSACWAGTSARRAVLRLGVREVTVQANSGEDTQGTLAWLPRQRKSWKPMRGVENGVYGTEESVVCHKP